MNDRIEELARAAGAYRIMDELRQSHMDGGKSFTPEAFEKFCKLIIQECMQCCDKVDDDDYDDIAPDAVTGMRDGALLCKIEIKQHFGL